MSGQVRGVDDLAKGVSATLVRYSRNIEQSLPKEAAKKIAPDRAIRLVMNEARRMPQLLECDPMSIVGAMLTASALGLEIGSHLGQAYLIPFKGAATFVPGYKGLIALAYRSGQIASLAAHVVYQGDEFEVELGSLPSIRHVPKLSDSAGSAVYYYAIAQLTGGGTVFDRPLTIADARRTKEASPGGRKPNGPWTTHFDEMARKTAVRRLAKYLPASPELAMAVAQDERIEANQRPAPLPELDWLPTEATGREGEELEALADNNGAGVLHVDATAEPIQASAKKGP